MEKCQPKSRMRILLAARKLFAQQGFDATTIRQICKEAKSNIALVSYHFGGKESVFFALFEVFIRPDAFYLEETAEEPAACMKHIVEMLIQFKVEQPEMVSIIQQEVLMNSPRLDGIRDYIYPLYKKLKETLIKGREKGLFHFESADNAMLFIIAIMTFPLNNAFIKPLITEEKRDVNRAIQDALRFIFDGLRYSGQEQSIFGSNRDTAV